MAISPATLALIMGGTQAAGGLFSGLSAQKINKAQLAEMARQFNLQHELSKRAQSQSEGMAANDLARQMQMAPLRDRLTHYITGRAKQPLREFRPRDMYNPSSEPPSLGGIDTDALAAEMGRYDTDPNAKQGLYTLQNRQQDILRRLGYI